MVQGFIALVLLSLISLYQSGLVTLEADTPTQTICNSLNLEAHSDESGELGHLPGNPDDLAWNALPDIRYNPFEHLKTDFEISEDGYYLPKRVLLLNFYYTATINDVNSLLSELDAQIVDVLPGVVEPDRGIYVGITLALRVNTQSFAELEALIVQLEKHPVVNVAAEYLFDGPLNAVPQTIQKG